MLFDEWVAANSKAVMATSFREPWVNPLFINGTLNIRAIAEAEVDNFINVHGSVPRSVLGYGDKA